MKASQEQFDLALDRRIDEWYGSRHHDPASSSGPAESTSGRPLDVDLSGVGALDESGLGDLHGLVQMLDLVAELAGEQPAGRIGEGCAAAGETSESRTADFAVGASGSLHVSKSRPRAVLALVAAVVLLIAGVGVVAAVYRHVPAVVPTHRASGPHLPEGLLSSMEAQVDATADPYPAQPVTWVKTSAGRLASMAPHNFGYAKLVASLPPATPLWIAYVKGNFYGNPPEKSGIFHLNWYLYDAATGIFAITGSVSSSLLDLSRLGTVHELYLRPPPAQPVLPSRILQALSDQASLNGNAFPTQPVLWVTTTVGRIRALTGDSVAIPAVITAGTTAWVAEMQGPMEFWRPVADDWYFTTSRSSQGWWLSSLTGIQRFGHVNEVWLAPGAPTVLSTVVDQQVLEALNSRYSGNPPATVSAEWVGTTVAAIGRLTHPQIDTGVGSAPGPTAVWVLDLTVTPTPGHAGRSDWVVATTQDPASGQAVGSYSEGGSPFFGITALSQLGAVHPVTFHVSRADVVTFGP